LRARGVTIFARDWHVKALASAAFLLKTLSVAEVKALMDWALDHPFWGDKTTTMHRLVTLAAEWQQARQRVDDLAAWRGGPRPRGLTIAERNMALIRQYYADVCHEAQEVTIVDASG
jgi:hypothetical protein